MDAMARVEALYKSVVKIPKPDSPFRRIPDEKLYKSEPNPKYFGNPPNEPHNPYWTRANWLLSRFHFSFAEHSSVQNLRFGVLRVLNDDLIQPMRGFDEHYHNDAEICTYVVHGCLTHNDSMGSKKILHKGSIQYMTAGFGLTHCEHNSDPETPLRVIQMWFLPRIKGLSPHYGSFPVADGSALVSRRNRWAHLISDAASDAPTPVKVQQDVNVYVADVTAGCDVTFKLQDKRQAYFLCVEGNAVVEIATACDKDRIDAAGSNQHTADNPGDQTTVTMRCIQQYDAAEVFGPCRFTVRPDGSFDSAHVDADASGHGMTISGVHVLLIEMDYTGMARKDL